MCGILGIINHQNQNDLVQKFNKSLKLLDHRGPDDYKVTSYQNNIFGFTRLAIIDLSINGMQPFEDEKSILVFNGEIYNFLELKNELVKLGIRFNSRSDGEVLKKYLDVYGIEKTLNNIDGMYAFCYFDKSNQYTILARDSFGEKPLYYSYNGESLIFSSEIKSLQSLVDTEMKLDREQLGFFLWKGYYKYEKSIFKNINTVIPNSYLVLKNNKITKFTNKLNFSFNKKKSNLNNFENLIKNSVKSRMISDHEIGCLISGGVDSAIIGKFSKDENPKIKTYSVNCTDSETFFINEVLKIIKTEHFFLSGKIYDILEIADDITKVFNEPFGDISSIFTKMIFDKIKDYHRVVLGGDGADEIFGGYIDGIYMSWNNLISKVRPFHFNDNNFQNIKAKTLHNIIFNESSALNNNLFFSGWNLASRKAYFNEDFNKYIHNELIEEIEESEFMSNGKTNIERFFNANLEKLSQDFLVKIDRISMHYSVEARSPFLNRTIFEKIIDSDISNHVNLFKRKILLKKICAKYFSNYFVNRKKTGFSFSISYLIKKDIVKIKNTLEKSDFMKFILKKDSLTAILSDYNKNSQKIWNLLILNSWIKKNIYVL